MNAATLEPTPRSPAAADLLLLSVRIRETEQFLHSLRHRRDQLLDQMDDSLARRLDAAAQERILEDVLSAPGPLADKLATGMRIVHEPPEAFDPDPDFAQHVADSAAAEAKEMAAEQAARIYARDNDGRFILDCRNCYSEFKTEQPTDLCPICTDLLTDSSGQA